MKILVSAVLILVSITVASAREDQEALRAADDPCQASGGTSFICGPQDAEDLVLVPETNWIISSALAPGEGLYLIDSQQKTWTALPSVDKPHARQDMEIYGACPGAPEPDRLVTHGLNIRPGADGHSTLYVVGHGGREAIEVFDVNAGGATPVLTWTGCVLMPEGMAANSVASFRDGSLLATIPLHPGNTIADALAGKTTGGVYEWSPGDRGFTLVGGTELPYANGIEVSVDEREFYVASSGLGTVVAYSKGNPARRLRATDPMEIVPDNLHMGLDGKLITAGLIADDPICGNAHALTGFDLDEFAACPRPFVAKAIDPRSMKAKDIARGPANKRFSNITMALPVGDEIWLGTFSGDRIGYRSLKQHD